MKINVEVLDDEACRDCPQLDVTGATLYGEDFNGRSVVYRVFSCANLETCRNAIKRSVAKK